MFNFSNKVSNTIKRHAHLQTFGLLESTKCTITNNHSLSFAELLYTQFTHGLKQAAFQPNFFWHVACINKMCDQQAYGAAVLIAWVCATLRRSPLTDICSKIHYWHRQPHSYCWFFQHLCLNAELWQQSIQQIFTTNMNLLALVTKYIFFTQASKLDEKTAMNSKVMKLFPSVHESTIRALPFPC